MAAPDKVKFQEAMPKEVRDHEERGHWSLIPISFVPEGANILLAVWSTKRKCWIETQEVYKWKSPLNLGGHKQHPGIDFNFNTYSPVVNWSTKP